MTPVLKTAILALSILSNARGFQPSPFSLTQHSLESQQLRPIYISTGTKFRWPVVLSAEENNSKSDESASLQEQGVVELPVGGSTAESPPSKVVPTFLSQGDIDPETLSPDMSDPKQARVIIYIILSLIPVLFLIPFMLGSRDLIPLDALPPVDL